MTDIENAFRYIEYEYDIQKAGVRNMEMYGKCKKDLQEAKEDLRAIEFIISMLSEIEGEK